MRRWDNSRRGLLGSLQKMAGWMRKRGLYDWCERLLEAVTLIESLQQSAEQLREEGRMEERQYAAWWLVRRGGLPFAEKLLQARHRDVPCSVCGAQVEESRICFAIPTCETCLPPAPPLEMTELTELRAADGEPAVTSADVDAFVGRERRRGGEG